jgi:tetratricopeptide (TPR) repeat protein
MADARPLCFVLMPFGTKPDPSGGPPIDFDRIYQEAIRPAVEEAGMAPIRADEEKTGGIIHKYMFERLLLCEYAVADLTGFNANVFYELGVRHAAREGTTQAIYAAQHPIPFDLNFLRALPYELGPQNRFGAGEAAELRRMLAARLASLRQLAVEHAPVDSPLFQLLGEWKSGDLARLKTDVFRAQVQINEERKSQMARARAAKRSEGLALLREVQGDLGDLDIQEAGVIVDLMLSYRALKGWSEMVDLFDRMPETLRRQVLVREQLAFALNRRAAEREAPEDRERAVRILEQVEEEQGPSAETCGLLGRIYKDLWHELRADDPRAARAQLKKAIDAYRRGFEADWRDAYPGVNTVTLLDIRGDAASKAERDAVLPVVRFAVEQRLRGKSADYWDHATMLELAVLADDQSRAEEHLDEALGAVREPWEPETTARNLRLIAEGRSERGEDAAWVATIVRELESRARRGDGPP